MGAYTYAVLCTLASVASLIVASDLPACDFFNVPEGYLEAANGPQGNIKCKTWASLEEAKAECLASKACDGFSFGPSGSVFHGCLKNNRAAGLNPNPNYSGYHKNLVGCCGGSEYTLSSSTCSKNAPVEQVVSVGKKAIQSTVDFGGYPERAVDGNTDGNWGAGTCTHTTKMKEPWWQVDLGATYQITKVAISNRKDCCSDRLHNFEIRIGSEVNSWGNGVCATGQSLGKGETKSFSCPMVGRHVNVKIFDTEYLTLCEVTVYALVDGAEASFRMIA